MIANYDVPVLQNLIQDVLKALERKDGTAIAKLLAVLPRVAGEAMPDIQVKPPNSQLLDSAIGALDQAMNAPNPAPDYAADLKCCPAFGLLYTNLIDLRNFILDLVKGDLGEELRLKGYLAGALKAFQANLRHLTWQAKMIALGDFSQRVDFMGEFSEAFNSMVIQLEENQRHIHEKQVELTRLNEDLRAEIELRKKTEESLRQSEELYRHLAITDPLTGILNRRQFFQLAMSELQRTCRYGRPLTVIIFDLDHFKQVNDTYGHGTGDQVLQAFANSVCTSVRTVDIFARYGGEEFILLLPETDIDAGMATADRLRRQVAITPLPIESNRIAITVSAGVSAFDSFGQPMPPLPETLDQLIGQADQALYEAKRTGRNRVTSFPVTTT